MFKVREYHDFEVEESLSTSSVMDEDGLIEVSPFVVEDALDLYVRHLPLEQDENDIYPWSDRAWQGRWLWRSSGLSQQEAFFWLMAMTHPLRHEDTQVESRAVEALRALDFEQVEDEHLATMLRERLRQWFEQEALLRREVRWFSYAYFSRLLKELLPVDEVLGLLWEVIPLSELRHFFVHLGWSEDDDVNERVALLVRQYVELIPVERSEEDAYTAVRLLERFHVEAVACTLCERVYTMEERSGFLVRDCVHLLKERTHFAQWFERFEDYHLAQEMIPTLLLRGGFEVVPRLMEQVVAHDDGFVSVVFKDLLRIHSWRAVREFVKLSERKQFSRASRDWIVSNTEHGVHGLLPLWLDASDEDFEAASSLLDEICARGHSSVLARHAEAMGDDVLAKVKRRWLDYYAAE